MTNASREDNLKALAGFHLTLFLTVYTQTRHNQFTINKTVETKTPADLFFRNGETNSLKFKSKLCVQTQT